MKTLLLDTEAWDLVLDANGNIALADEPYSIAQDVASAVRTFISECWYDTSIGIPYFTEVLGQWPPVSLVQGLIEQQALTVPDVVKARCVITDFSDRQITGQIQVIDVTGQQHNVSF
ncbi:hypothetical protein [Burkholderia multivorans]|uniref:hypothetical protein n=1 Tax=Burkholderia multivorans TaxID=87883 RepID=UPI00066996B5|nr:hypothetical protein [Burkholderia multivorans]